MSPTIRAIRVRAFDLRPPAGLAGAVLAGLIFTGCASLASRVPSVPARAQADAEQKRDRTECEALAVQDAEIDGALDWRFASCLIARGYRVSVPVRVGVDHARVDVQVAGQAAAALVWSDLRDCETQVAMPSTARRPSARDVVVGSIGRVMGGDLTQVRPHDPSSSALAKNFSTCLSGRGYRAAPWEPRE